jgi:hypothetical protein
VTDDDVIETARILGYELEERVEAGAPMWRWDHDDRSFRPCARDWFDRDRVMRARLEHMGTFT